ncbi:MAG: hypothetical protein P8L85_03320 [Rubripirellula sp.]|nr:hypothetical protein [Rubripirellula sp.]
MNKPFKQLTDHGRDVHDDSGCDHHARLLRRVRQRQAWTILFAIVLVSIASFATAQPPAGENLTGASGVQICAGVEYFFTEPDHISFGVTTAASSPAAQLTGGAIPIARHSGRARVAYAELVAALANFDADADPDGWRAEIALRDRNDQPVLVRATATFELTARIATQESNRFVNATNQPIRWSRPLNFDEDGVARINLPLRNSLKPMLGWTSASGPNSGIRFGTSPSNSREYRARHLHRNFVTSDLRTLVGMPRTGELRVRVSVPTEGVYEAASPVNVRPSVLVDTQWPYR